MSKLHSNLRCLLQRMSKLECMLYIGGHSLKWLINYCKVSNRSADDCDAVSATYLHLNNFQMLNTLIRS